MGKLTFYANNSYLAITKATVPQTKVPS